MRVYPSLVPLLCRFVAPAALSGPIWPLRLRGAETSDSAQRWGFVTKPSNGLEPLTPSLPWRCSTD
jgi:hypothetical protein